ncbi:MAG: hypothetical protein KGR19_09845 [Acidobacteria bacterium]|nr:hypothetical protein [Acidobacteriota bacterium]
MASALRPAKLAALLAAVAACGAFAAPALANYEDLLLDACGRDGKVNGTYSQEDYRKALANIPADADQYSDCRAILRAAQLATASGEEAVTPATAGDILATATPEELAAINEAIQSSDGNAVNLGGDVVSPDSYGAGREVAAGISDLPTPLKAALGLLAVGALAALLTAIVPRVRDRLSR